MNECQNSDHEFLSNFQQVEMDKKKTGSAGKTFIDEKQGLDAEVQGLCQSIEDGKIFRKRRTLQQQEHVDSSALPMKTISKPKSNIFLQKLEQKIREKPLPPPQKQPSTSKDQLPQV